MGPPSCREAGPADQVEGTTVRFVATPRDLASLADLMAVVAERELTLLPRGSGSKFSWLEPPPAVDVLLDMRSFSGSRYDPETQSVTVGAGIPLATVQDELAPIGRRLGLDAPSLHATIGGIAVTGESGPLSHHLGPPAAHVCDAIIVLPDGTVTGLADRATLLGASVFDLRWAYPGWPARASVVAELNLQTEPLPGSQLWLTIPIGQPIHAGEVREEILCSGAAPSAIELELPGMRRGGVCAGRRFATGALCVLLEGSAPSVLDRAECLRDRLDHIGIHQSDEPPVWWGRYPFRLGEVALRLQTTGNDLHMLSYALADAVGWPVAVRGSVSGGLGWAALPGEMQPLQLIGVLEVVREVLLARGGSAVVQAAPAHLRDIVAAYRHP
jgi:glycolate dehydrogenase FAD-binding subunit